MKSVIVFMLQFFVMLHGAWAISSPLDSLMKAYTDAKHDTTRCNIYLEIGDVYEYVKPDSAIFYYTKSLQLAQSKGLKKQEAKSLRYLGVVYYANGKHNTAIEHYEKSYKICEELGDKKGMSSNLNNIGVVHRILGNYNLAVEYYKRCIEIHEKLGDKKGISDSYNNIGLIKHEMGNYSEALEYYHKSLETLEGTNHKSTMASSFNNIGVIHFIQGKYELALEYFQKSLQIKEEMGDKRGVADNYINIGNVNRSLGNFDKTIEFFMKALMISEEIGDKRVMATCYGNIGIVHYNHRNFEKAIEYYQKSLKLSEELGNKRSMSTGYGNLGLVYNTIEDFDKALEYYQKSLKISEEIGDRRGLSICYVNIGNVFLKKANYDKAIEYFKKTLKISEELGNKEVQATTHGNLAQLHLSLADSSSGTKRENHQKSAMMHGEKAYSLARELGGLPSINQAAATLQLVYTKMERYKEALRYADIYISTRDSLFSDEKTKILAELNTRYETEKKQQELEKQLLLIEKHEFNSHRQRLQRNFALAGSVLLILLALFIFRGYYIKKESNKIISEKNILLQQANEEISATMETLAQQNEELRQQRNQIERAQKHLVQSEKMASIGVLTAGIAHEINNPMNFVYAGVNSLLRDFSDLDQILRELIKLNNDEPGHTEIINRIKEKMVESDFSDTYAAIVQTLNDIRLGAQRTSEIVEGLRNFSRAENEVWGNVNIHRLLDGLLILLNDTYKDRIQIVKNYDENLREVECKPGKINQIFMNLITNAIDAIEKEGTITITTKTTDNEVEISFKDSGTGIAEEEQSKIFDPFFTTKPIGKGVGLGLAIAHAIVQEHQGSINVISQPGKGAEFKIVLPLKSDIN
jgi:signal transduction histidine kinase/Tfp pilus assembly protein PilF